MDILVYHDGGYWLIRRRKRLGAGNHVRLQIEGLAAPPIARAAKSTNHFVGHEKHIVFF